ncbi:MAG: plasmid stabilization protein [Vicinamibacterales bacterium]
MASITIRNLDDSVKKALRRRAAENGRSMEEEARLILGLELRRDRSLEHGGLGTRLRKIWADSGLEDGLPVPPRTEMPRRVDFGDEGDD